jgi:hypothetical protein
VTTPRHAAGPPRPPATNESSSASKVTSVGSPRDHTGDNSP